VVLAMRLRLPKNAQGEQPTMRNTSFEKAMKLAALSGLKATFGPAIFKTAQGCPTSRTWVAAALGEMLLDKMPLVPSRSRLPLLIPRAISGAWVARESMRAEGHEDEWAAPMGAAVAAGVALFAPMIRKAAGRVLDVADALMGVAEDYAALRLGCDAVGMSMDELGESARRCVQEMSQKVMPALQSMGAGSM
jgi:hypothetical protein